MNYLKSVRMDDHNLLLALAGIISAFGVKEVWAIIQKKMDIGLSISERSQPASQVFSNGQTLAHTPPRILLDLIISAAPLKFLKRIARIKSPGFVSAGQPSLHGGL